MYIIELILCKIQSFLLFVFRSFTFNLYRLYLSSFLRLHTTLFFNRFIYNSRHLCHSGVRNLLSQLFNWYFNLRDYLLSLSWGIAIVPRRLLLFRLFFSGGFLYWYVFPYRWLFIWDHFRLWSLQYRGASWHRWGFRYCTFGPDSRLRGRGLELIFWCGTCYKDILQIMLSLTLCFCCISEEFGGFLTLDVYSMFI